MAFVPVEADEFRARIAAKIREATKRRGMTLSKLAEEAGVSPAHLWAVLGGEKAPTSDTLVKLARVLRIDPGELTRRPRAPRSTK